MLTPFFIKRAAIAVAATLLIAFSQSGTAAQPFELPVFVTPAPSSNHTSVVQVPYRDPNFDSPSPQEPPSKPSEPIRSYRVSIIIDDLGYAIHAARELINMPYALTLAIIPFAPYSERIAREAHQQNKEVMLHTPMETLAERKWEDGLNTRMQQSELLKRISEMSASVPYIEGINNHGGSKLTQQRQHMDWLMAWVAAEQLYFVDSRTTSASVATDSARDAQVPYQQRDVFLDNEKSEASIRVQLGKLVDIAKQRGHAIGIGHPYPETLAVLRQELPQLALKGIQIVPVSSLLNSPPALASDKRGSRQNNTL